MGASAFRRMREQNAAKDKKPTVIDYDEMSWQKLKALVIEKGGTYTNMKTAIEFLKAE